MGLYQPKMHQTGAFTFNLQDMTITVTMGKLPSFEIEDASDEQKLLTLEYIESMQPEDSHPATGFMRPSSFPKLEVAE